MSYYDIDSILTDAQVGPVPSYLPYLPRLTLTIQKLPCTFELEVPGLGVLEGNPGENV